MMRGRNSGRRFSTSMKARNDAPAESRLAAALAEKGVVDNDTYTFSTYVIITL